MQHDASDCAAAVVSTVMLRYKKESTIMKVREMIGTDAYGTTVKGIMDGLEKLNFNAKVIRTTVEQITADLTYPAIAQIQTEEGLNHFVVIHKVTKKDQMIIADPAKGIERKDKADGCDHSCICVTNRIRNFFKLFLENHYGRDYSLSIKKKSLCFSNCLCLGKVSGGIARVVSLIGGFWAGFLAGLGSALAIGYLGNKRVFY